MKPLLQKICKDLPVSKIEAEHIAARLLNCSRHELYFKNIDELFQKDQWQHQLVQLKNGIPLEYIIKKAYFLDLELYICPGVFIPRVETELLIEIVKNKIRNTPCKILEIGTGTGAISIALARIFPDCTIIATDISRLALNCAYRNIKKYKQEQRIILCRADRLNGIRGKFDLVISNPPYISLNRLNQLPKSVCHFEPITALYGGIEGIDFIANIVLNSYSMLNQQANITLEIDDHQVNIIRDLLTLYKIDNFVFIKDLFNRFRYLIISK